MELYRKPFEEMRWEEIWDTVLRILLVLVAAPLLPIPSDLFAEEFPGGIGLSVLRLYHHESRNHRGLIAVLDVLP